jgi:integrase
MTISADEFLRRFLLHVLPRGLVRIRFCGFIASRLPPRHGTGELLALKRSCVDLEEGLIYVKGRVTKNGEPKTAPIYGDMGPWLRTLLSRGQTESPKCLWLFSRDGKPIHSFKGDWAQACEKAGVPGHALPRFAAHCGSEHDSRGSAG